MGLRDLAVTLLKAVIGPVNKPAGVAPSIPPAAPVDATPKLSLVPGRRIGPTGGPSSLIPGGEVFSDEDPYLSGGEPLIPKDDNAPPRRFQYQPGYNIAITPRSTEAISFALLRAMGDSTLVRVIIEHLKEAIKSHEWDITTDDDHEAAAFAPEIARLVEFFERPDGENSWDEWVGMLLEEVLVVDALTLYRKKTYGGELLALEVIDGTTIKVLCDTRGFIPNPPTPAYQQFLYGVPKTWYTKSELIYAPKNRRANKFYGFSPVEQLLVKINEMMRREFSNLAQFTDGNTPAGIMTLPKEWNLETIRKYDAFFNERLAGNPQTRSKLVMAPEGSKVQKFNDDETFGLFSKYDEWLARVACFTFGVSPMPFITLTNRAAAQEMGDVEAEGGVASLKLFLERIINQIIDEDFGMPHLRFNWITDRSRLQEKRVKRNVQYAQFAIFTPNEVRADEGKEAIAGGDILYFNGTPLGMAPAEGAPSSSGAAPGEDPVPARPDQPDGSRPVLAAATSAALRKCIADEVDKWERFAIKRLEEGKPERGADFEAEFLPNDHALAIVKGLAKSRTKDQIKHLFDQRRLSLKAIRFDPPGGGETADHSQSMKGVLRDILTSQVDRIAAAKAAPAAAPATPLDLRIINSFDQEKLAAILKGALDETQKAYNLKESERRTVETEAIKAILDRTASTTREAINAGMEKIAGAMVDAAKAAKPAIINLPEMSVINRVEASAPASPVTVLPAPVTVQPAPVEKAARPKRSYRIVRDPQSGDMVGLEEK